MIEKSNDRVWLYDSYLKKYYLLGAGITNLKESYKTAVLETPNVFSPFCGREILYHTGQLEFEGVLVSDPALEYLLSMDMKRGKDSLITFIIVSRKKMFAEGSTLCYGKRIEGAVCIENPGTGEGVFGSRFKGKILYTKTPEKVIFDEATQTYA